MIKLGDNIAENIRRLRKGSGYSQEQLAEKIDKCKQTISKWENGETRPGQDSVKKLAELFTVSESTLMYGYAAENTSPNEDIKRIYEALDSMNKKISLLSNGMIIERYMNSSDKSLDQHYEDEPDFMDTEEAYNDYMAEEAEKAMDEMYALDVYNHLDFAGSIKKCDEHISKGDATFAHTALEVYEAWRNFEIITNEEEEREYLDEQSKYAKIYIHYLMKKFRFDTEDLLPLS
jgi:transcriptional regulator with XRE-family HTH domain